MEALPLRTLRPGGAGDRGAEDTGGEGSAHRGRPLLLLRSRGASEPYWCPESVRRQTGLVRCYGKRPELPGRCSQAPGISATL